MSKHAILTEVDRDALIARMRCEGRELEACRRRARRILELLETSRSKGIFAAADERKNPAFPFMLRLGLRLMNNGADPEEVLDILGTYIVAGNHSGAGLLTRVLVLEGVAAMQDRKSPSVLANEWSDYLGSQVAPADAADPAPTNANDADGMSLLADETSELADDGGMDFRI